MPIKHKVVTHNVVIVYLGKGREEWSGVNIYIYLKVNNKNLLYYMIPFT